MVPDFLELVNTALFVQDNALRGQAEARLITTLQQLPDEFYTKCSQGLVQESLQLNIRSACGTLLKRGIEMPESWSRSQEATRSQIKTTLLQLLVSTDSVIKKAAAMAIASICAIELPRNEWPSIIPSLVNNTTHEQLEIKKAAIMTLGYICEALKNKQQVIDHGESERILVGICQGLNQEPLKQLAIKALQDSFVFMNYHYKQQMSRDHVTKLLLENVISGSEVIRIQAIECLIDYQKYLFDYLDQQYIDLIWNCTQPAIISKPELAVPAMEVWNAIAQEIIERGEQGNRIGSLNSSQKEILQRSHQILLQTIMANLLVNQSDDDDDENSVQETAQKTIASICEAVGPTCFVLFTTFIDNTLQAPEWQKRKAALLAFAALTETTENEQIKLFSQQAIPEFINKLQDPSPVVQIAASKVIAKISENYPEAILGHAQVLSIYESLVVALQNKNILKNIVFVMSNLANAQRKHQSVLRSYITQQLQQFVVITARIDVGQQEQAVFDYAWSGIFSLMQGLGDANQLVNYLTEFANQLRQSIQAPAGWRKESSQQGLLATLHAGFLRLNQLQAPVDPQIVRHFYEIIVEYFKSINQVNPDGMYAISAIALYAKRAFSAFSTDYIENYLSLALRQIQEPETFKVAVLTLSDIARALYDQFSMHISILDYLIKCLNDNTINRENKLNLFTCITDIMLATGHSSERYAQQVIDLIVGGMQLGIQIAMTKDPNQQDYAELLYETLVNSYMCVCHAFNGHNKPYQPLQQTISQLTAFIQYTADVSQNPAVDYIRNCLWCLVDYVSLYKNIPGQQHIIIELIQSPIMKHLIETLKRFKNNPENHDALVQAQLIFRSLNQKLDI